METLTLQSAPGDARKEILFTRSGTTHSKLAWRQSGADVSIELPKLDDGELPFSGPLVVKLEGGATK